jgi:hypothetical protein
MGKAYKCPVCSNEVDVAATVCSNPACRAELALCSHCRDITTYVLAEERKGRTKRNRYRCDRCQRLGVKCYTWLSGGYCNGLARSGETVDMPLCASCSTRAGEVSRSVISWTLIGAVTAIVKKK